MITPHPAPLATRPAARWAVVVVAVLAVVLATLLVWRLVDSTSLTSSESWGAISRESKLVTASQKVDETITYEDESVLPDWLAGQRAVVDVQGEVNAFVDLGAIEPGDITVADDGTVTVELPPIQYSKPSIDHIDWQVDDRGLLDRVSDLFSSDEEFRNQVITELNHKLTAEAAGNPALEAEAKANAAAELRRILEPAGATRVVVRWKDAGASSPT